MALRTSSIVFAAAVWLLAGCSQRGAHERESTTRVGEPLQIWSQQQKLTASSVSNDFGRAVALSGDAALIGASGDDDKGAAWIFTRSGTTWTEQKKLTVFGNTAPALGDAFGYSVALSGETALIGAPAHGNGALQSGTAFVFVRSGTTWGPSGVLNATPTLPNAGFGSAVALSGDTAVIGSQLDGNGAVYVFARSGGTFGQQQKLTGDPGDGFFAYSVAVSGDTLLVGARYDDEKEENAGAAYVFVRSGSGPEPWGFQQKLTADDGFSNDEFGVAVALSGETAVVGSWHENDPDEPAPPSSNGSAYVFVRTGTTWVKQAKLTANDASPQLWFGWTASLSGEKALLGANESAYVFERSGTVWTQMRKLTADGPGESFNQVALDENTALVGAQAATPPTAYVFELGLENGDGCVQDAECLSLHCVDGVCCDEACEGACRTCLGANKASGADGVCGNAKANTDPRGQCAAPASCPSATSQNLADTCDGAGTCVVTAEEPCQAGYVCSGGACNTSCSANDDCDEALGFECLDGKCKIPAGADCTSDDACETGYCAPEGVCCDAACDGECEACVASKTGEQDGVCAGITRGTDPDDECEADPSGETCAADGFCDGQGSCRSFAPPQTVCGAASCSGADQIAGMLCDGEGNCKESVESCAPYGCSDDACESDCDSSADCASDAFCDASSECQPKRAAGESCDADEECATGTSCLDGTCASGATCSQDGASLIDPDKTEHSCAPYRCEGSACLLGCKAGDDCVTGYVCNRASAKCETAAKSASEDPGCGCRAPGRGAEPSLPFAMLGALGLSLLGRRVSVARRLARRTIA